MVKDLGMQKCGREGVLIKPENNEAFLQMRREHNIQPSFIPIVVSCGKSTHNHFKTNTGNIYSEKWCRECFIERLTKYRFDVIKRLVEGKGGTLIEPSNQEEYEKLLAHVREEKDRYNTPNLLPLEVSCNKGHRSFKTTPDNITQNHWCPLCGERYSVVGKLIHPIFEFLILKLLLLKECNAKYERKIISDKKRFVDIIIERNRNFIGNIENTQSTLIVPDFINFIIIDFTIGISIKGIIDHCVRGYQSNDRLLIIVLLRFRNQNNEGEIERMQEAINNDSNIDKSLRENIRLFTSDDFLDFLNLRFNLTKWNSRKEEFKLIQEEIKIVQEYKRILAVIEDVLSSDSSFNESINDLAKLSDIYKKRLKSLKG